MYGLKAVPFRKANFSASFKAVCGGCIYGTAEPVPFVQSDFFRAAIKAIKRVAIYAPKPCPSVDSGAILDNLQPSLRDSIMFHGLPRTSVLG
jgi:hypothetical protein